MHPNEIKAELIRRGIRQRQIADRLGFNRSTVCNVIAGRNRNKRVRRAIARAINRPLPFVFAKAA